MRSVGCCRASVAGYLDGQLLEWAAGDAVGSRASVGGEACALTGAALVGYTLLPAWWMMVLLGIATGLGAGAIDAGLNTYAAAHFGAGLMQWLHASYGVGVTLGPIIMTAALGAVRLVAGRVSRGRRRAVRAGGVLCADARRVGAGR